MTADRIARRVLRHIFVTAPAYYSGLLEKADAYGVNLFDYVKRRVLQKMKEKAERQGSAVAT